MFDFSNWIEHWLWFNANVNAQRDMIIQQILETLFLGLIFIGTFLYFVNYRWFQRYADLILGIFIFVIAVITAIIKLFPTIVINLIKYVLIGIFLLAETAIYLLTFLVPIIGAKASPLHNYVDDKLFSSGLVNRIRIMRGIMVDIIAENDQRPLLFDTKQDYLEELGRVRQEAEIKLNRGESALSLTLGLVLLITQLLNIKLFQLSFNGITGAFIIEFYLFLIATSIVYRISVLKYLTFSSDVQFESIEKIDVALSYQKGVCFTNVVQVLMPVLVISFAILDVDRELVKDVLTKKYSENMGIIRLSVYAWGRVRNQQ